MALLAIKTRKKYFKLLGFGEYNYASILKMQKKYFHRAKDHDGLYGPDTDALLRHLRNVKVFAPSFDPTEFRCPCGKCTGYPTRMKTKELKHIQAIRDHYKKPMVITSGLRCKAYNNSLKNSAKDSPHLHGYAVDFYMAGVTDTPERRAKTIEYIKTLRYHHYTYGNAVKDSNGNYINSPAMGNALHTDAR